MTVVILPIIHDEIKTVWSIHPTNSREKAIEMAKQSARNHGRIIDQTKKIRTK